MKVDGIFCGYGALSLRKVKTASQVCNIIRNNEKMMENVEDSEDARFSYGMYMFKRCTPISICCAFAIYDNEYADYWMEQNGKTPFGYIF